MVETFLGIQVISIFFALFMLYLVRIHYKRHNLGYKEYVFWCFSWVLFIVFATFPQVLTPLLTTLSIVRAMDLLMVVAFMILTYVAFMDHIAIRDIYRKINKLVTDQAKTTPERKRKRK
jgi:hypothetical protein